jgi:hypothetical protein
MARKSPPAPSRSPREVEREEEHDSDVSENNFLDSALSEIPNLEVKKPPGHEDPPAGEEDDGLTPPVPSTKLPSSEPPKDEPVKPPAKAPAAEPKPPTEIPSADDKKGKAEGQPVDKNLEDRLAKIVPKTPQEEKGYAALKTLIRETNTKATAAEAKLSEREKAIKELETKVLPEQERLDYNALREYIRNTAIENDPEFKREYTNKLAGVNADVVDFLTKNHGMAKEVVDVINKRGGMIAFSQSQHPAVGTDGKTFQNKDGSEMTEQQFFEAHIFGRLPLSSQQQVAAMMARGHSVEREREAAIENAKKEGPNYLTRKQQGAVDQFNKRAQARLSQILTELPEDLPREVAVIPEDASDEDKKRLTEQNTQFQEAEKYIEKMTYAQTPEDRVEVAGYAAAGKFLLKKHPALVKQITDLTEKLADAEKQLDDIRSAQSMGRKRSAPPVSKGNNQKSDSELSDEEAIDKYLP